jgi:hypothetical protein
VTRYLASVEERENGRFSLNHDETYAGVLAVAGWVDRTAPFDTVSVYRRSGENLYFNEVDANGKWTQQPRLRQTIEAERGRVWTEQETQGFLTTIRQARAQVDSLTVQGAPLEPIWLTRIADAAELATPLAAATSRGQLAETIHELRQDAKIRAASAKETSRDGGRHTAPGRSRRQSFSRRPGHHTACQRPAPRGAPIPAIDLHSAGQP